MFDFKSVFSFKKTYIPLILSGFFTVLVLQNEYQNIQSAIKFAFDRVKSNREINQLFITYSRTISLQRDRFIEQVYESDVFHGLNFAFEDGTVITNSDIDKHSTFDRRGRAWYVCAKKKKQGEYCVTDVYLDVLTPSRLRHVITFSYPVYEDGKFLGVGVSDINVDALNADTHFMKLEYYRREKPSMDFYVMNITACFFMIFLVLCILRVLFFVLVDKVFTQSRHDLLTGLKRREHFSSDKIDARTKAFCFLDIDHFKSINDTYGHDVGDKAIKSFSDCIRNSIRAEDVVFRWGGEEFLILVRGKKDEKPDVPSMMTRLCEQVEAINIKGVPKFTVSVGFYEYRVGDDVDLCIKNADIALYKAKRSGRNRVIRYDSSLAMDTLG
ncbi:diguanylate cyclase domain-containing protein [Veronia pacifica]|uniref:diguanylate cyclase n=1 Tax=Veronia pacifica TaxID=1080227 RepID=A0A1C3EB59_9GAMM|nr:diguanylate cyclase [Veronia pacifica]ODA30472.1 hypothetical protein A8L45_20255 [Veronia pacifica]